MTQRTLAVSNSSRTYMERDTETEWLGAPSFSLSDIIDLPGKAMGGAQELEQEGSATAQVSSLIAERLDEFIDAIVSAKQTPIGEKFSQLQEWEGIVSEVGEKMFVARLTDMNCKDNPEEEADFLIEDVRKDDQKLLRAGAVFRWVIGYDIKKDGAKRRASQIVFRRLPQ